MKWVWWLLTGLLEVTVMPFVWAYCGLVTSLRLWWLERPKRKIPISYKEHIKLQKRRLTMGRIAHKCDTCRLESSSCKTKESDMLRAEETYASIPNGLKYAVVSCAKYKAADAGAMEEGE